MRRGGVISVCGLAVALTVAGCGGSGSTNATKSLFRPWNLAEKISYLNSCHHLALKGIKGVTNIQRENYCEKQLQLALKDNPKHQNIHGFVGAHAVTSP